MSVDSSAERADVQVRLIAMAQRTELLRAIPHAYREAASRASAMRGGRTPGNFFLAWAYEQTRYGKRPADRDHGDITGVLDSFLAVDSALHSRGTPNFSAGAYGPARLLGMPKSEAAAVSRIYYILDGAGVRQGMLR